jgi:molybdopterin converting factor small subunit
MKITVEFMAQLRVAAGEPRTVVECDEGTTVAAVLGSLARTHGEEFRALTLDPGGGVNSSLLVAVEGRRVRGESVLRADDALVLGTPISGG